MITERMFRSSERWVAPALVIGLMILLAAGGEPLRQLLRYDRAGIEAGDWYRLITGHWVHLGWAHTGMNAAAVLLLAVIDIRPPRLPAWLWQLAVIGLMVSIGLCWLQPSLRWYVGLSGVLHGMFVLVLLRLALQRDRLALGVLLVLVGKLAWEHYHGPLSFSRSLLDAPVIVAAHSYGAVAGLIYSGVSGLNAFRQRKR